MIKIVRDSITLSELKEIGSHFYKDMIKGVVDLERKIVAFGGVYHIEANDVLIKDGSKQTHLWGFNIQFNMPKESRLEYNSLINIRPLDKNTDAEIESENVKKEMAIIINSKII